jgi:hypothetical protein
MAAPDIVKALGLDFGFFSELIEERTTAPTIAPPLFFHAIFFRRNLSCCVYHSEGKCVNMRREI